MGETIIFDGEVTNIGNHYDVGSSKFTCPVTGIYAFGVNIMKKNSMVRADVAIVLDGSDLTKAYADYDTISNLAASNFVVTQCSAGQTVWVRAFNDSELESYDKHVTFIGFLLHI